MDVTLVIPAYNEARRLPATLRAWHVYLHEQPDSAEVVVVDDGSADDTAAVAESGGARVIRLPRNQGKGGAVRAGVLAAHGDIVAYVDADLNVAPQHLGRALELIRGGADVVVGQRTLSAYAGQEGVVRVLAGGLVQVTRRALVLRSIRDTQCGFKVFRKDIASRIFRQMRIRSFAFDIEALFLARRMGARVIEMPVTAEYRAESTFDVRKHLPRFLKDIGTIRLNAMRGRYTNPP